MNTTPRQIDLRIDEVVLHGFDGLDAASLRPALERELTRLLTAHGIPPSWTADAHLAQLDGGTFTASPHTTAPEVGRQIARAAFGRLKE